MTKFLERLRALPESKKIVIFFVVMGIAALITGFIGMRFIAADFAKIKDVGKNVQLPNIEIPEELKNLGAPKDETAHWNTYADNEYRISFQYPADWIVEKQFSPLSPQSDKRDGFKLHPEIDTLNNINIDHIDMDCGALIEKGFNCSMVGGHIVYTNSENQEVLNIFNQMLSTFKFTN